ncbi:hypothetical protein SDC9_78279 [bioreactor metagenome]|uniref:Uncharacterized protein n=1 Tax=bioreactor metagenome TaxID=1076179 RepID=A0A644YT23_9ZZZZ
MLTDNPAGLCAKRTRRKHVFVFLNLQYLAPNKPRHTNPVEQAEHDEQTDHVHADLFEDDERGTGQYGVQNHRKQNNHQQVRRRIDDVYNTHHHHIQLSAGIPRNRTVDQTDHQHDQAREQANQQRNTRAIDHPDEVIAGEFIGSKDMREQLLSLADRLLFPLGILKRSHVFCALVALAVDGDHLIILIRHNHRRKHDDRDD